MDLSPEEKRRIYEEEKFRLEAQKKLKGGPRIGGLFRGCGCLTTVAVVVALGIAIAIFVAAFSSGDNADMVTLKASVRYDASLFRITNNNSFDWTSVKLEVNPGTFTDGYVHRRARLPAGESIIIQAMDFAKPGGERLNILTTKPQSFRIESNTPYGSGSYNGEW